MHVGIWFWSWIVLAVVLALAEAFDGHLLVIPWSGGAALAAALEWLHVGVGWQWIAFLAIGSVVTIVLQRTVMRHRP